MAEPRQESQRTQNADTEATERAKDYKRQHAADIKAEEIPEGRLLPEGRTNFHD